MRKCGGNAIQRYLGGGFNKSSIEINIPYRLFNDCRLDTTLSLQRFQKLQVHIHMLTIHFVSIVSAALNKMCSKCVSEENRINETAKTHGYAYKHVLFTLSTLINNVCIKRESNYVVKKNENRAAFSPKISPSRKSFGIMSEMPEGERAELSVVEQVTFSQINLLLRLQ